MAKRVVTATRDRTGLADKSVEALLASLVTRELAAIAAIDAAIASEARPDYVVMYRAAKTGKQSNVEQMVTMIRMAGGMPAASGGLRKFLSKGQTAFTHRIAGTSAALHAMRVTETSMLQAYIQSVERVDGLAKQSLLKALGRTLVHWHLLTAHLAKRTGSARDADSLPQPLYVYFAGPRAKACMRCHLDRPGAFAALERVEPHPYTYICAGCHGDVRGELLPGLESQINRWPQHTQEARVLQHALERPSVLNAIHTVLFPLSGLAPEPPRRPIASMVWPAAPPPAPADRTPADVTQAPRTPAEAAYVKQLFDYRSVRTYW